MIGKIKISILLLGSIALIAAAIAAGQIDQASAVPPGPPESVPVEVINTPLPITGDVGVTFPASQDVNVTNFPSTQDVNVTNLPASQDVSVTNFPATQDVNVTNSSLTVSTSPITPVRGGGQVSVTAFEPAIDFPLGSDFVLTDLLISVDLLHVCTVRIIDPNEPPGQGVLFSITRGNAQNEVRELETINLTTGLPGPLEIQVLTIAAPCLGYVVFSGYEQPM